MPKLPKTAKKNPTVSIERLGWIHYNTVQFIHDNGLGEKYREFMESKALTFKQSRVRRKQNGN